MVGYQQYLDVASSRDVPTFRRRIVDFADRLGFPLINATLVVEQPTKPPAIVAVRNTPEGSAGTSNPAATARDPVIAKLKTSAAPFIYDQSTYVDSSAGDLWEEQAPLGYRTGISMAMHMTGGRHFLLGVDRSESLPNNPDNLVRLMADLQLLAAFAQETAVRLLMPKIEPSGDMPSLTRREQEILKWVGAGKSSSVIGELLNISADTVNYHLRTVTAKLGVASRHQAVAKASGLGLI